MRTDARQLTSCEVRSNFVSELCQIPPETLAAPSVLGEMADRVNPEELRMLEPASKLAPETVCYTEIRLSTIFIFPRKSFTLFPNFTDRASWLP